LKKVVVGLTFRQAEAILIYLWNTNADKNSTIARGMARLNEAAYLVAKDAGKLNK